MDTEKFELVDGLLANDKENDQRETAISLLEVGVQEGTLRDVAETISARYCLRPAAVIEWYTEVLNRRVRGTQATIDKLKGMVNRYG